MGKIICLMGKSSSGKDTIYKNLMEDKSLGLRKLIPYTTRPMREGEQEGVEYHFNSLCFLICMQETLLYLQELPELFLQSWEV